MKTETPGTATGERLFSLDVLRGFDMFWIIGGEALIVTLAGATGWSWMENLAGQMHHVKWNGFHFYDLIFPLFMFISGVAIPYALVSRVEKGVPVKILVRKVLLRMGVLVTLGIVYNGTLENGFGDMRVASVLGQIGIAYAFAAFIVLKTPSLRGRIIWLAGIWSVIAGLQFLVPVPGYGAGVITPDGSINAWIDQHFLPGRLYFGNYDPEGILCIVSATTVTLLGTLAGTILRNPAASASRKAVSLLVPGLGLLLASLAISTVYPIIKNIWTVPFTMLTAGISFLLLAGFYLILDVAGWRKGSLFFRVIGLNSITIYLGTRVIDFHYTSHFLLGWLSVPLEKFGPVLIILGVIGTEWLLLYYLYRRRIFLKV